MDSFFLLLPQEPCGRACNLARILAAVPFSFQKMRRCRGHCFPVIDSCHPEMAALFIFVLPDQGFLEDVRKVATPVGTSDRPQGQDGLHGGKLLMQSSIYHHVHSTRLFDARLSNSCIFSPHDVGRDTELECGATLLLLLAFLTCFARP
jgi:hypothetical protein